MIIDTSAAYFEGDEFNNNVQIGAHARLLRMLVNLPGGPCVLANCHPVKNAAADNLIPYGGGAFLNEVDGNLTCSKDDAAVEVHWQGKFRGPDFAPITFQVRTVTHQLLKDSKGRLIPTVIAEYLSETGQQELVNVARSNEDKLLEEIARNGKASLMGLAVALGWYVRSGEANKAQVQRHRRQVDQRQAGHPRSQWPRSHLPRAAKHCQTQRQQHDTIFSHRSPYRSVAIWNRQTAIRNDRYDAPQNSKEVAAAQPYHAIRPADTGER